MDAGLKSFVRRRAGDRYEYCRLAQSDLPFKLLQVEHIRPRKHRGSDDAENLALACHRCNCGKASNLTGFDDVTNQVVLLFNPRTQRWDDHFRYEGPLIVGLSPTGRATVDVLNMNEEQRVRLREKLMPIDEEE